MGRQKIYLTPDEEEEFQRVRLAKNLENQRRLRDRNHTLFIPRVQVPHLRQQHKRTQLRIQTCSVIETTQNDYAENYIGLMDNCCIHCNAKHFAAEKVANKGLSFNNCCSHGAVVLDAHHELPDELREIFELTHRMSNDFFNRIRCYNHSLSFTSFNANLINFNNRRPGPYCFKMQGQIYYQVNTALYSEQGKVPNYGQLFIIDSNEATDHRLNHNSELDRDILITLDRIIREHNVFAQSYQMMGEEIELQRQMAMQNNEPMPEIQMLKPGVDQRRYNFQRSNEVAAIFTTTADGEIPPSFVTIRDRNTRALQYVSTMDPNVEPWVYPLLYPHGSPGWHRDLMRSNTIKRVSRNAYVKYRIAIRDDFNPFLMGRRLFQQWIVDSYVKIEKDRIEYCRSNQKQLRAETYQGLIDYLQEAVNDAHARVGKMVILPSTFVGSLRNMLQNYQDVRKFGKPDLFITMTCNPKWREITENLLPKKTAADRPDICARVFNIKKDYLIDLIIKQNFFRRSGSLRLRYRIS